MTSLTLKEQMVQRVNIILLHNLVRPHPITNYIEPKDINAYREWLESEVETQILTLRLVQLDENQSKPNLREHCHVDCGGWTQQDMLKAGFRRVKETK